MKTASRVITSKYNILSFIDVWHIAVNVCVNNCFFYTYSLLWSIVGCPVNLNFTYVPLVNGCYHVVRDKLKWAAANERCVSLHPNSHLVIINSEAEQTAVTDMLHMQKGK